MTNTNEPTIIWSNRRTRCPLCGSSDGFAALVKFNNENVSNGTYGKCFACDTNIFPTNDGRQHEFRTEKPAIKSNTKQAALIPDNEKELYLRSLFDYSIQKLQNTSFAKYLFSVIHEPIYEHLLNCCVGGDLQGNTVFWYRSLNGSLSHCKIIPYNNDGHRLKGSYSPIQFHTPDGVNYCDSIYGICNGKFENGFPRYTYTSKSKGFDTGILYNEHYLNIGYRSKSVITGDPVVYTLDTRIMLVESEKSAVLGSFVLPECIWIACGGAAGLSEHKAEILTNRKVLICFDNDQAGQQRATKSAAILHKFNAKTKIITPEMLKFPNTKGYDIADSILDMFSNKDILYDYTERWYIMNENILGGCL